MNEGKEMVEKEKSEGFFEINSYAKRSKEKYNSIRSYFSESTGLHRKAGEEPEMMGDYSTTSYIRECKKQTDKLIEADLERRRATAGMFAQDETLSPEKNEVYIKQEKIETGIQQEQRKSVGNKAYGKHFQSTKEVLLQESSCSNKEDEDSSVEEAAFLGTTWDAIWRLRRWRLRRFMPLTSMQNMTQISLVAVTTTKELVTWRWIKMQTTIRRQRY